MRRKDSLGNHRVDIDRILQGQNNVCLKPFMPQRL